MLIAAMNVGAEVGTISIVTENTYSFSPAEGNLIAGVEPSAVDRKSVV